jgi:hypothetical protein
MMDKIAIKKDRGPAARHVSSIKIVPNIGSLFFSLHFTS